MKLRYKKTIKLLVLITLFIGAMSSCSKNEACIDVFCNLEGYDSETQCFNLDNPIDIESLNVLWEYTCLDDLVIVDYKECMCAQVEKALF